MEGIRDSAPGVKAVKCLEGGDPADIFREGASPAPALTGPDLTDPAVIFYTSGSTGRPKGVVHTHETLYYTITNRSKTLEITSEEVGLAGTQISHIGGFAGIMLTTISNGGTCVIIDRFEPAEYIRKLRQYRPTLLFLLPTQMLEVLEHHDAAEADFSRARHMMIAGDKCPHHVYELFRRQAGFDLTEGCGMTECEGYCIQPLHEAKKPGSMGKPIAGVTIRIAGSDGKVVPDGRTGEIQLKAPSLMQGYWDDPGANERSFVDGWFRTGDLGYRDTDGFYFFVGRIKEIIVRGGSNVMPAEVEDVLDDHPKVLMSGVVGIPDDHLGNRVAAFVVPEQGVEGPPTPEEFTAFAAGRLADYKIPERWFFVDVIPRNPTGKIDRHRLHEMVQEQA